DALYGTDALLPPESKPKGYDPGRGAHVIDYGRRVLDEIAPLTSHGHADALGYAIVDGRLEIKLAGGGTAHLKDATRLAGWQGPAGSPTVVLLLHNGLHLEIRIDRKHVIGKSDAAGIADLVIEAAVTTIMDCEDSVAAADAADKTRVYRNWLGLMKGDLKTSFTKGGQTAERSQIGR